MRPVLIGMNNPLSMNPKYALFPHPPGCTGHRLFKMLQSRVDCFRQDYLDVFERMNLVTGPWCRQDAEQEAMRLTTVLHGRTVVLLGRSVLEAFFASPPIAAPLESHSHRGVLYHYLPHPSGRNHWYNDPVNRESAAKLLEVLYNEALHTIKRPVEA